MRIHYLENLATSGLGNIESWAAGHGYPISGTRLHQEIKWPDHDEYDLLVVLGGVPQECEGWLADEIQFIQQAINANKRVLGICLGSQLIAEALGGKLIPHTHAESGWWTVSLRDDAVNHPLLSGVNADTPLFFFHRNTFTMPEGAQWLATSRGCPHQIFAYKDRVIGIQAHPEMFPETMDFLAAHRKGHLPTGEFHSISIEDSSNQQYLDAAQQFCHQILDNLVNSPGSGH